MILTVLFVCAQTPRKHAPPSDKWAAPVPRLFAAAEGNCGLKVTPLHGGGATGAVFAVGPDGLETAVWVRTLEVIPVEAFVSRLGHVASIDSWGARGKRHALVMYDRTGKTLSDYSLEDLFPGMNPRQNPFILVTPSSNHWTINAHIEYVDPSSIRQWSTTEAPFADRTASGLLLRIQTAWNETLLLDPDTGKLVSRQKRPSS